LGALTLFTRPVKRSEAKVSQSEDANSILVHRCRGGTWADRLVGPILPVVMPMEELPLADVRNRLSELVADVEQTHARVTITKHGHPAAMLISPDDLAAIEETLGIMSNARARAETREEPHRVGRPLQRELTGYFSGRRGAYRVNYRIGDGSRDRVRVETGAWSGGVVEKLPQHDSGWDELAFHARDHHEHQ